MQIVAEASRGGQAYAAGQDLTVHNHDHTTHVHAETVQLTCNITLGSGIPAPTEWHQRAIERILALDEGAVRRMLQALPE